jgi:histidine triad (HIT) family protein
MTTIFEQIIARKKPAEIVYESDHLIAIKDIHPVAPVHLLIITKKVIPSLQQLTEAESFLLGEVGLVARQLAEEFGISDCYRLLTNVGSGAGQSILHLHFHLIGGRPLWGIG